MYFKTFAVNTESDAKRVSEMLKIEEIEFFETFCPLDVFETNEAAFRLNDLLTLNDQENNPRQATTEEIESLADLFADNGELYINGSFLQELTEEFLSERGIHFDYSL